MFQDRAEISSFAPRHSIGNLRQLSEHFRKCSKSLEHLWQCSEVVGNFRKFGYGYKHLTHLTKEKLAGKEYFNLVYTKTVGSVVGVL